ncbi:uncharacterized protein LOC119684469 [Teleopsis dalmanni]|uniref:uncharacterized protein LOC119684469 n=1 Tax=Teleopsis dalmanni TaxID=139649 RepID=UPI0018CEF599|nr:uncharacterized protein LOC119684469 [Teleopsis dalmanni]
MDGIADVLCFDDLTVEELKNWLTKLKLQVSGNKTQLIARLTKVPQHIRSECAPMSIKKTVTPECDEAVEQSVVQNCEIVSNERNQIVREEVNNKETEEEKMQRETTIREEEIKKMQLMQKEIELLKKERDLFEKENELTKKMTQLQLNTSSLSECKHSVQRKEVPLIILKEFLPECDGNNFNVWVTQLEALEKAYELEDNVVRTLIITKAKGRVQNWLHSTPNVLTQSSKILIEQMISVFGSKESIVQLRRKFETRLWSDDEKFVDYYNDKIVLSLLINMSEEELVEYIVDGIRDPQLRMLAKMQQFKSKEKLVAAFGDVNQNTARTVSTNERRVKQGLRCFNCSNTGHVAAECRQPKRPFGACYGCGSLEHRVAVCPSKKFNANEQQNNYNA